MISLDKQIVLLAKWGIFFNGLRKKINHIVFTADSQKWEVHYGAFSTFLHWHRATKCDVKVAKSRQKQILDNINNKK